MKDFFDRYGPTAAVLTVLVLLVVLMPGNAEDTTVGTGPDSRSGALGEFESTGAGEGAELGTGASGVEGGGGAGTGSFAAGGTQGSGASGGAGGTGETSGAGSQGPGPVVKDAQFTKEGPNCRGDGRQNGIAVYMPPCAGWTPGTNNGGATSKGVNGEKILVTRFRSQTDAATQAALVGIGADDTDEDTARMTEALRRYYNHHNETYGREVVIQDYHASGKSDNDEAMRADAVRIATEIKAFANVGGPNVLAQELANRGVICMCTVSLSQKFYLENPPYIFSTLPTGEEYGSHIAEYVAKRLAGRPAKHAGSPDLAAAERKFGQIWYEGNKKADPYYQVSHRHFLSELKKYGVSLTEDIGYVYDLQRAPDQSTSMISKMRSARVSNLIFTGDPLYPIFLTQEATRQGYFPEWLQTGTALTDTTFFGRTYDKAQWDNSFGISPLYVFWDDVSTSSGYREYHHGLPGGQRGDEGVSINVLRAPWQLFFIGVHMAGPNLTPDTFAQGMFSYPRSGGTPANPLSYFTRSSPTQYKDFTEVWWDSQGRGKDETAKEGAGILMKSNQGARYEIGRWPVGEAQVFDHSHSVYTADNPPGGRDPNHEQDGHSHPYDQKGCLSCAPKR